MDWEAETSDQGKAPPVLLTKEPYPELGHTSLGSSFPLYILECALENLVPSSGDFFFFFTGCPVNACSGQGLPGCGAVGKGPSRSAVADEVMGSTWGEAVPWGGLKAEKPCPEGGGSMLRRSCALRGSTLRRSHALKGGAPCWGEAVPWGLHAEEGAALRRGCAEAGSSSEEKLPPRGLNSEVQRCLRWIQPWGGAVSWGGPALRGEGVVRSAQPPWAGCCSHEGLGFQEGRALGCSCLGPAPGFTWELGRGGRLSLAGSRVVCVWGDGWAPALQGRWCGCTHVLPLVACPFEHLWAST